jgi:phage terminase large subunit
MLGDCNPSYPTHWIKHKEGLVFYESRHEDNPTLYTADGKLTDQGVRTMSILDALTGVRYRRLRLGQWAGAEGAVYEEWDAAIHLINPFPIPKEWRRFRAIDFGFVNPFVCGWWAMDHDDNLYLYRELYMAGRTVAVHAAQINQLSQGESYEATVADHDTENRATLAANGIRTVAARKDVSSGIQAVQERLKVNPVTKKPRLFILRDALVEMDRTLREAYKPTCTAEEFDGYVWQPGLDGRPLKEQPVKVNDHGLDMLRYMVMHTMRPKREAKAW